MKLGTREIPHFHIILTGQCYEPDSLLPTPHEHLNTNPLIESLAECARADAIVICFSFTLRWLLAEHGR